MKGKLTVLMITAFVDMLGLAMVIPLLPFYATKLGASATIVGVLIAAFSIAQLASAPLWGRFSDRYGRRPALLAGLIVSAIAYVIFAYASTLWLLLLSRVVQVMGLVLLWFSPLWLVWMLVMLVIGKRHPPTLADHRPVGRGRVLIGLVGLVVFALCFTPKPILISWGDFVNSFRHQVGF